MLLTNKSGGSCIVVEVSIRNSWKLISTRRAFLFAETCSKSVLLEDSILVAVKDDAHAWARLASSAFLKIISNDGYCV